ncbi:hypothetical protein AXE65_08075 [Ventosimonas gracilis]|uniref:Uncharacterized protein n=1 Tax=Ventosimonas gracilis TaxID=1680762 RepID=A0A139SHD7_9GAMM|nr:hypothetical protein [Ventosimonas gracilis]KXU33969.1 hypothetical protein AXE65_08075 [Ventosimonas gracilis]
MKNTHQINLTKRPAQPSADKQQSVQHGLDDQYQELQSILAQAEALIKQQSAEIKKIKEMKLYSAEYFKEKKKT